MREQVIKVVEKYLDAVERNDEAGLPLDPGIVFESPPTTTHGIAEFRESLARFVPILKGIKVVRLAADDESCSRARDRHSFRRDPIPGILLLERWPDLRDSRLLRSAADSGGDEPKH